MTRTGSWHGWRGSMAAARQTSRHAHSEQVRQPMRHVMALAMGGSLFAAIPACREQDTLSMVIGKCSSACAVAREHNSTNFQKTSSNSSCYLCCEQTTEADCRDEQLDVARNTVYRNHPNDVGNSQFLRTCYITPHGSNPGYTRSLCTLCLCGETR